jgi:2-polyprenyl-3-methyl-5-hydroxy-6-metoxy-1,4-benzoquinol methylase
MAASGYLDYAGDDRFQLAPEQAEVLAHPDSPAYAAGGFQNLVAATRVVDRLTDAFRDGAGIAWHEHHPDMFEGTERFFRPGYAANLTTEWIPAFDGLADRLQAGATVADVGCGLGTSTRIMAQAYPASTFVGIDYHEPSVRMARERAADAGLTERLRYEIGSAQQLDGRYDLIAFFDCLHDMPDPMAALRAARAAVAPDGWVMLVEPASGDRVEDLLNPLGRLFIAASLFVCLPSGLSAEPRTGLGNQAGPARTLALAREAGFGRAREAVRTPFNAVYELRP